MKKLIKNIVLGTFLAGFATISSAGGAPQAILDYFEGKNVSYIVRYTEDMRYNDQMLRVVTWNYLSPSETCEALAKVGVRLGNVTNYAPNGDDFPTISISNCK